MWDSLLRDGAHPQGLYRERARGKARISARDGTSLTTEARSSFRGPMHLLSSTRAERLPEGTVCYAPLLWERKETMREHGKECAWSAQDLSTPKQRAERPWIHRTVIWSRGDMTPRKWRIFQASYT